MRYPRLVLLLLLASTIKAAPAPVEPPMPGRLIDVGGYRVHLYCTGDGGPAVVVVSGGFSVD